MAGQKKLWGAHPTIEAQGGEEHVLDLRASGLSVQKVCNALGVTPRQLYHWIDKGEGADVPGDTGATRRMRWNHANTLCAEALVDKGAAAYEALRDPTTARMRPDVTREEIALTKAETDFAKFHVGALDPDRFGTRPSGGPQITIGSLFIEAAKQVSAEIKGASHPALPPEDDVMDATVELLTDGT